MTVLRDPPNLLTALSSDLSQVARDCRDTGREAEARRLDGAARRLAILAGLSQNLIEIEPEQIGFTAPNI